MTRRASVLAAVLSVVAAVLVAGTPRAGAATCATSSPASGAFSATVCIGAPLPGATVSGDAAVTVTVSMLGSSAASAVAAAAANNMPTVKIRSVFIAAPLFVSMEHKVVLSRL